MAISDYYTDITKLKVANKTPNGRGGYTYTWASACTFKGLINQARSREIEAAAKLSIEADHKLFCGVGVNLRNKDMLQQGTEYYRVVSKPKNTVGRDHHLKILLKEVSLDQDEGDSDE